MDDSHTLGRLVQLQRHELVLEINNRGGAPEVIRAFQPEENGHLREVSLETGLPGSLDHIYDALDNGEFWDIAPRPFTLLQSTLASDAAPYVAPVTALATPASP